MKWNLRMVAAQRGIWRSSDLRRALSSAGLEISMGKMSNLWSGNPISVRLDDLNVICTVLECSPNDVLILSDPAELEQPTTQETQVASGPRTVRPSRRRLGRSAPPV